MEEEEKQGNDSKYIISCGNYEGGLLGLSIPNLNKIDDLTTEYAFSAT